MSEPWETLLEEELIKPGRLAILGVGNMKKADDAAGSLCVALVRANFHGVRPDLLVLHGGPLRRTKRGGSGSSSRLTS